LDNKSWNPLNTARHELAGCGIQTAALAFGGNTTGNTAATEEYNGSILGQQFSWFKHSKTCFSRLQVLKLQL
jgi:hypothetical protein